MRERLMNEKQGELTSALLDGELDRDGQLHALSGIFDGGPEALARFGRYRLIGDTMRGEATVPAGSVAQRVHSALRDEPVVLAPPRRSAPRWLRPVAGLAVAASVAAAAVVVAPQLLNGSNQGADAVQLALTTPQITMAPQPVAAGPAAIRTTQVDSSSDAAHWQTATQDMQARLNRLLIEHNEFGGHTGINGPVPHIGFVSYGGR